MEGFPTGREEYRSLGRPQSIALCRRIGLPVSAKAAQAYASANPRSKRRRMLAEIAEEQCADSQAASGNPTAFSPSRHEEDCSPSKSLEGATTMQSVGTGPAWRFAKSVQGRSLKIGSEPWRPQSRCGFVDAVGVMLADTLQHIHQIVVGVDCVERERHDQVLNDPGAFLRRARSNLIATDTCYRYFSTIPRNGRSQVRSGQASAPRRFRAHWAPQSSMNSIPLRGCVTHWKCCPSASTARSIHSCRRAPNLHTTLRPESTRDGYTVAFVCLANPV